MNPIIIPSYLKIQLESMSLAFSVTWNWLETWVCNEQDCDNHYTHLICTEKHLSKVDHKRSVLVNVRVNVITKQKLFYQFKFFIGDHPYYESFEEHSNVSLLFK